jgi:translocator protein
MAAQRAVDAAVSWLRRSWLAFGEITTLWLVLAATLV